MIGSLNKFKPIDGVKMEILLIDDETDLLDALRVELNALGHQVVATTSRQEADPWIRGGSVDLIICDLRLRGETGIDILKFYRDEEISLPPFVFLTGYATKSFAIEALMLGAFDVVEKPHAPEAFAQLLEDVLESRSEGSFHAKDLMANKKLSPAGFDANNLRKSLDRILEVTPRLSSCSFIGTNLAAIVRSFFELKVEGLQPCPHWNAVCELCLTLASQLRLQPEELTAQRQKPLMESASLLQGTLVETSTDAKVELDKLIGKLMADVTALSMQADKS